MGFSSSQVRRYSSGAIFLHWAIAFILAVEIAIGFTMPKDASGFALYQLHKSLGITILVLSLLRLFWRMTHKKPPKLEKGLTGFLSSAVHVLFYVFMILAPLTGWLVVSSAEIDVPTLLFGVVPWPHLPVSEVINGPVEEAHEILAFVGLGLFVLHFAGALRHHFLRGSMIMERMAPGGQPFMTLLLATGVVLLGAGVFFALRPLSAEPEPTVAVEEIAETGEAGTSSEALDEEGLLSEELVEEDVAEEPAVEEDPAEEVVAEEEAVEEEVVAAGPPSQWTIQPGGSLRFSISSGDSTLNGSFSNWDGQIAFDPENPQTANLAITVQLASASMGDATQNQMLQGSDFFSASAFPTATWRSTNVTSLGEGQFRANGTLNMKGVSRPQSLNFSLAGEGDSRNVTGTASIDRGAFGVGVGDNAAGLGAQVNVSFSFSASR